MHRALLFLEFMVLYAGLLFAAFAIGIGIMSIIDPRTKPWAVSMLAIMFWPVLPLFSRLGGRDWFVADSGLSHPAGTRSGATSGSTDRSGKRFGTIRAAKDYLANAIADEAEREGVPLSKVERKMLYFSETDWTLPDMAEISAEFDRDYDQGEYEQKIADLVRGIETRADARSQQDIEAWDEAVLTLSDGDHYILVLIDPTLASDGNTARPPHDRLKLVLTAFAVIFGFFAVFALLDRIFGPDWNHFGVPR